jgi:type I restriction enzyme S subunit
MSLSRNLSGCQVFHPSQVPADWECVQLKDRLELLYGRALKEEIRKPGDIEVFGSNGKVGSHNEHWLDAPGVLVGRKGTVGAVHFATKPFWPIDTTYYVKATGHDDLRYLFYLLDYLPLKILNAATGVPGLSRRDAYALLGAFPSAGEQASITRVLDEVNAAVDRARQARDAAVSLDHSLLHEILAFGPAFRARKKPTHWLEKRVDEVAEVGSGVTLGKDVTGFKHVELPYLRVANVQDGRLDLRSIKTVKVRIDDIERYRLEPGDVLMTEGGDLDKLGRGTLWDGQIENCLHQNHIFRIRADRALLDPRYFAFLVESDIAKRYFSRVAKRTTNLASTNKTQVRAFRFPVPPLDEQAQCAELMIASKARLRTLESKLDTLIHLKKSVSHDLLTGAVRVDRAIVQEQ